MDTINWLIINAEPVVTWLFGILVLFGTRFIANKIKSDTVERVTTQTLQEVSDVVLSVYQTYVSEVKKLAADGTLTTEEKRLAKDMALVKIKELLGPAGLERLRRILSLEDTVAVDKWLDTKVEAAVAVNRKAFEL